ncbi:hypothetical protein [Methylomonas albis]|uniref:Glycosyltransferase RgtA/B/C/D-like domain-containing protein n=1 Tax=Methylomonas albis TaxID=1854563 RepID=A0ABR9CUP5_9GAMM|nr:hypothetical protein [Methylomonas albis]MBD9354466.1 hypothetical protein [Methylomonas albis]CAD6877346.1 hypothetical protein [Methylomonas albis]
MTWKFRARLHQLLILSAISLLVMVHVHYRSPSFPFSPDSAGYIEQARNFLDSGSLLNTPYGLVPGDQDQVENRLFPIGFAVVLAAVSSFGIDAKDAAVGLAHFSAITLPWLLFFSFRRSLGTIHALLLAGLAVLSPGVLKHSLMGLTDVFGLWLATAAIGLTLNSRSIVGFIFAGLLAGVAYAIRNVHLALLATIVLYFGYCWLSGAARERRAVVLQTLAAMFGMAVVVVPLLLRNFVLFGSPNPYLMGPSTIGFVENLRTYIEALLKDGTACSECARYVAWSLPGLLGLGVLLIAAVYTVYKYLWSNVPNDGKKAFAISTIYLVTGSCVVVAARTRYQWGELINLRHTLQYSPYLLAGLFVLLANHGRAGVFKGLTTASLLVSACLVFFHVNYALYSESFRNSDKDYPKLAHAFASGKAYLCGNQADTYLVSNWAHVFRIECGARVRQIEAITGTAEGGEMRAVMSANDGYVSVLDAINDIKQQAGSRPIRVGFFPGRFGVEPENLPLSAVDEQHLLGKGWQIFRNDQQGLLLEYSKIGADHTPLR